MVVMRSSADVIVVGGGVIGCSVGYHLAARGLRVTVLECGTVGGQASSAATGLLAPFKLLAKPDDSYLALQRASLALFPALVEEIEAATGMRVEYHETGTVRLAQEKQVAALRSWAALWSDAGMPMEVVQDARLASLEPGLSPSYRVAVFIPGEPQVRAASFMAAMAQAARLAGVTLLEGCQVIGVEQSGARAVAVRTAQGETIGCSHVVLAAGAWSGGAAGWLGLEVPVRPLQGQSLLLPQAGPAPVRHTLFGEGIYVVPRADKTLVVGSTYDEVGFACQVTPDGVARLLSAARRLVPALSKVPVLQAAAGLRPRTPDSRPILGPAPLWENVTLATGHNGFGVLLSPLTGQIVADVITTGRLADLARPFTIERFHASATSAA
jgi:glycine oxidase